MQSCEHKVEKWYLTGHELPDIHLVRPTIPILVAVSAVGPCIYMHWIRNIVTI